MSACLAFVCAMPIEAEPLVERLGLVASGEENTWTGKLDDQSVVTVVTGMGTAFAHEGTTRLLDAYDVDRVVVVGITGALENDTPIGTLIRPAVVLNSETGEQFTPEPFGSQTPHGTMWTTNVITPRDQLPGMLERGVVSLDMETAAIARVCEVRGIPWAVFRTISDRASDGTVTEEVFKLSNQDGTPNHEAIAEYFTKHPEAAERMAEMGRNVQLAVEAAATAAIEACRA
jgi:adenosylhomocysteine nucleosidase